MSARPSDAGGIQVICAGLGRTGTKSLQAALNRLGRLQDLPLSAARPRRKVGAVCRGRD